MNIREIVKKTKKPHLYEKGSSFMWTDPYISKQLLQVHLNPDVDIASRKQSTIEKTSQWILESFRSSEALHILDLGCGPGLYTEIFAKSGHQVSGIDISESSIDYAIKSARDKGLSIQYQKGSYLDIDLGKEQYDLIVLIYTDLGVLPATEREKLLGKIFMALKKGGIFIFDLLKDKHFKQKISPKSWEVNETGFWRESPYVALSESFLYEKEKVIMFQHTIIEESGQVENYRFWTHFFSHDDISLMLKHQNYRNIEFREDILPEGDLWNGDNVIFTKCEK